MTVHMPVSVSVVVFRHAGDVLCSQGSLLLLECPDHAQYAIMRAHNNLATSSTSQQEADVNQLLVAAEVLRHLADPTRLRLLRLLAEGEQDVSTLSAQVVASRSSVSQHLGRLRLAGLVRAHRVGRRMLYRITSDHLSELVNEALEFADHTVRGIPHHHSDSKPAASSQ
jgi:DNA-binding transcriptional ArsR family regulator